MFFLVRATGGSTLFPVVPSQDDGHSVWLGTRGNVIPRALITSTGTTLLNLGATTPTGNLQTYLNRKFRSVSMFCTVSVTDYLASLIDLLVWGQTRDGFVAVGGASVGQAYGCGDFL